MDEVSQVGFPPATDFVTRNDDIARRDTYHRRGEAPCFDLGVQMSAGSNQNPGNICCY